MCATRLSTFVHKFSSKHSYCDEHFFLPDKTNESQVEKMSLPDGETLINLRYRSFAQPMKYDQ